MRIGIDMIAAQSPWSRLRGIGRLGHNLARALIEHDRENEYVLYGYEGLPDDRIPAGRNARVVTLRRDPARGEVTLADLVDRLARANPDRLDVLLLLSPMEYYERYGPPPKPLNGLRLAAVVHDVIPFLFQETYLPEPQYALPSYQRLETLKQYDVLLANSDATRADFLRLLGLADGQVVTIGCASEEGYFAPDRSEPMPAASADVLRRYGIDRPFVFNLGGMDQLADRKNLFGLIEAFRLLPEPVRGAHQLVLSCFMTDDFAERVRRFAEERGLGDSLVLTNEVSDAELRVLYQRCAAFAFPSLYEGFGLPILEAMQCGAAVVAGHNSAQVEVVGDAGLLANAHDPADIAAKLARLLADPGLAARLGERALAQARRFSWRRTARRALDALERSRPPAPTRVYRPNIRLRADRGYAPRPRLAVFSPFPPKLSGISYYAQRLVEQLKSSYAIDLYHDVGYIPEPGLGSAEFGCYDYRLFDRHAQVMGYQAILYQMGNSIYHRFIYEYSLRYPGVVTLHDFNLTHFQYWYAHLPGSSPELYLREIEYNAPERFNEIRAQLDAWTREPDGLQVACARRGLYLNRRVFEHARAVVVHSPWCLRQAEARFPALADRVAVIPLGASPREVSAEERMAIRDRFDLPREALILGSFGYLSKGKMYAEVLEAFAPLARSDPSLLLMFVGQDWENGDARRRAEALGVVSRVRFLGRQSTADFDDLIAATDIGINLRRPPTNGETSASLLDLLRMGVPAITSEVGTFADYPDSAVVKVAWERDGLDGLGRAIHGLVRDPEARRALGRAARDYVARRHDWRLAAERYEAVIEAVSARRRHPAPLEPAARPPIP